MIYYCKDAKKLAFMPNAKPLPLIDAKYSMSEKLKAIKAKLGVESVLVQGEAIGNKVQGNPYKFAENECALRVFNIKIDGSIVPFADMEKICFDHGLEPVPYAGTYTVGPDETMENFVARSDGKSALCAEAAREGLVYRPEDYKLSFKAVSNAYLLKKGE